MIKIAFLGDIALIGKYDTTNLDVYTRLKKLKKELSEYDYVIANLESPFTTKNKSMVPKSIHLKTHPKNIQILKYLNINAVTLANNHINDFGEKVIKETIKTLEENNIEWFGLYGKNLVIEIKNIKFSISGFCCLSTNATRLSKKSKGVNFLDKESLISQLKKDKKLGYQSILSLHWGREHSHLPNVEHVKLVETLSKKYNFIVHGHHPHVIQPIIEMNKSLIAFSLGNFIFDDMESLNKKSIIRQNDENRTSFILVVEFLDEKYTYQIKGTKDCKKEIEMTNISSKMNEIIKDMSLISNEKQYNEIRNKQFNETILEKFGKRTLIWYLKKLNINSICAKVKGIYNKKKYQKIKKSFLEDFKR